MRQVLKKTSRVLFTLAVVVCALFAGRSLWNYYIVEPWTRDARVRADIVGVAPDVSGLVSDILVQDNDTVKKGDMLFKVDVQRFQIALDQAEAAVAGSQAMLDQARRDRQRGDHLDTVISKEQQEQARTAEEQADANNRQAVANLALARLNRERSEVRAPVNGKITNLTLRPGDYVMTGSPQIALVDTDSFRIEAYFEETKLARVQVGDPALIKLMGQSETIHGHVASVAAGIEDTERTPTNGLLPNINPTFSWVRLAQRIPVRIVFDSGPPGMLLVSGRSATVEVLE